MFMRKSLKHNNLHCDALQLEVLEKGVPRLCTYE